MWDRSSLTRDQTYIPCTGRILNHWTAREVPAVTLFFKNKATTGGNKINKVLLSVKAECCKKGSSSYFLDFRVCENFNNKRRFL